MRRPAFPLILILIPAAVQAADLSLPLGGYYRTGRYMPVRFGPDSADLRLTADGAVTTLVPSPAGGVAPWLIVRSPVRLSPLPLHELQPNEKLVGFAIDAPDIAARLFPGDTIVQVTLDPADPLPGAPAAWQSLDAVVLDNAGAGNLPRSARETLLAGGTTLAVRADAKDPPDILLPWKLENGFWVVRAPPSFAAVAGDDYYAPAAAWQPGPPARYRREVLVIAIIIVVGFIALRQLPPLMRAIGLVVWSAGAVIGIQYWDQRQSPILTAQGTVHVAGAPATADAWIFQRADRDCAAAAGFYELAFPLVPTRGGPQELALVCNPYGRPDRFTYRLLRDRPAAFVFKSISMEPTPSDFSPDVTSPLQLLVTSIYAGDVTVGEGVAGLGIASVTQWPPLLLERPEAIPRNAAEPSTDPSTRDSSSK